MLSHLVRRGWLVVALPSATLALVGALGIPTGIPSLSRQSILSASVAVAGTQAGVRLETDGNDGTGRMTQSSLTDGNDGDDGADSVSDGTDHAKVIASLHSFSAIRDSHAHDLGGLAEWQPGYYVAHWWSPSGQTILGMREGDTVMLDGKEIHIVGVTKFKKTEVLEKIRDELGYDYVMFQTCYPDEYNRLVYGYGEGMGGFSIVY